MSAQFPGNVATALQLTQAYDNYTSTTTGNAGGGIGPATMTIGVTTAPPGPNCIITLGSGPMSEQVLISAVSGTTLTVAAGGRGFGGSTAQSWTDPTVVAINEVAYSHNQLALEVAAIETALGANVGNYVANTLQVNGDGTTISGGGNLSANRTYSVIPDSSTQRVGVELAGTLTSTRKQLNFIAGNGIAAAVADNSGANRADITISSGGSPVLVKSATYQVLAADFASFTTIAVPSGTFVITLVASTSQPAQGLWIKVINYGSGVVTILRSGQNINGGTSSLVLPAASGATPTNAQIVSDGTNYFASQGRMVTVSNGGTVVGTEIGINFIQGANTTLTVADNPTNRRVDVTVAATSSYAGPTHQNDVTSSRFAGTAYHNATGLPMWVYITPGFGSGSYTFTVDSDASSSPTTTIVTAVTAVSVDACPIPFMVLAGNWYEVTYASTIQQWIECF